MRRILATLTLTAGLTVAGAGVAHADDWASCRIWHGEQYCRTQLVNAHIPTRTAIGPAGRDCHTSWADKRRGCDSQA